jgi:hypothetical protein
LRFIVDSFKLMANAFIMASAYHFVNIGRRIRTNSAYGMYVEYW